jgi:hypothetical protein
LFAVGFLEACVVLAGSVELFEVFPAAVASATVGALEDECTLAVEFVVFAFSVCFSVVVPNLVGLLTVDSITCALPAVVGS